MRPAAPQCISGRTSYLRVRLAFHPYPQLIRNFCNRYRFGPSRPITGAAAWPWVAHTVSGLPPATGRALHTRFPSGSGCHCLNQATDGNSSGHTPKGTRSPWCQRHPTALTAWTRSVSGSISLPSPGCFSPFPHGTVRYRSQPVVSLGPWSTQLPTRFLVSRGTRAWASGIGVVRYGTLTLCGAAFQPLCAHPSTPGGRPAGRPMPAHNPRPATPAGLTRTGFWQIPFRSPLLWDLFRFLGVLRCFSSPTYLPSKTGHPGRPGWGCPIRRHVARCLTAAPHAYRCWSASFIGWLCRGILPPRIMSCLGREYSAVMGNAHDPSARTPTRRW